MHADSMSEVRFIQKSLRGDGNNVATGLTACSRPFTDQQHLGPQMDPAAALSGTETDQIPTCDIFAGNRASIAPTRTEPLSHLSPLQLEERGALLESVAF